MESISQQLQTIKPVYFDILGRRVANLEVHINNSNDVSLIVIGNFSLLSKSDAKVFFESLDFAAVGLSSTKLLYKGDDKNPDQYAGEIFFNERTKRYGIGLFIENIEKFKSSGLPLFGWDGKRVDF